MKKRTLGLLIFTFLSVAILSCTHDPIFTDDGGNNNTDTTKNDTTTQEKGCDPDTVYFVNDILPLLQSGCAVSGCHDDITKEHRVVMTNYADIIKTGEVKKGNANGSKLYEVLRETGEDLMPPKSNGGPFSSDKIALIKKWIDQGALENECTANSCDTSAVSYSNHVSPIIATYCQGCHNNSNASAYVNVEGYNNLKSSINGGRLMGAIRHKNGFKAMPQSMNKLSDCDIRTIAIWIENGMPNN